MEWGRIGSPGTVREQLFETEQSAAVALGRRTAAKTRRGYRAAA
jgi:predicted DNA-binding WGR domain protein